MTTQGYVEEIFEDKAKVRIKRSGSCGDNCSNCNICNNPDMLVTAYNCVGATVGDTVIIEGKSKNVLSLAFFIYIVPLLLFGLSFLISKFFKIPGIIISILIFVVWYIIAKKINLKLKDKINNHITGIITYNSPGGF